MLTVYVAEAQYISEVLEYTPAPGQFINESPWGTPQSAQSIVGGVSGSLSLGAFGGSVIFRFEEAVENHPDNPFGVDFTIFGNPMTDWSEPGVVFVMEDENGNGAADDTWYELAGSDYYFSSTKRNYSVTYTNPGNPVATDVPWEDISGNHGKIMANSIHLQPYYPLQDSFPGVPADACTLTGTLLEGAVDVNHPPLLVSARRAFGYADNQRRGSAPYTLPDNPFTTEVENSGGDAFDINWAVNKEGDYVELERIHFVKVQSGILHQGGYLGEVSTEITGAVDVAPEPGINGNLARLVIKDLPPEMDTASVRMEGLLFRHGRPVEGNIIRWRSNQEWAVVDEDQQLKIFGTGSLTISATVDEEPLLHASVSTHIIPFQVTSGDAAIASLAPRLYPNPAGDQVRIAGVENAAVTLFTASGRMLKQIPVYREGMGIECGELLPGVYLLKVDDGTNAAWLRLLKQ